MFINFYFDHYPNGSPDTEIDYLMRQMRQDYGLLLDDEEMSDFKLKYEQEKQKFPALLAENPGFAEAGVTTYDQFREMKQKDNPNLEKLGRYIMFEIEDRLGWDLQAYGILIGQYEDRDHYENNSEKYGLKREQERYVELEQSGSMRALLPHSAISNYQMLYGYISVLVLLGTMLLLIPTYVRDRRLHILGLQYASRSGRKVYGIKALAGMIVASLAACIQLLIFFILYRGNDTSIYMDVPVSSAFSQMFLWLDLTFGQYIVASIVILILLNAAVAAIVMMTSALSGNYITVIGVLVLLGVILFVWQHRFLFVRQFHLYYPNGSQLLSYAGILLAAATVWLLLRRRERRRDVRDGA